MKTNKFLNSKMISTIFFASTFLIYSIVYMFDNSIEYYKYINYLTNSTFDYLIIPALIYLANIITENSGVFYFSVALSTIVYITCRYKVVSKNNEGLENLKQQQKKALNDTVSFLSLFFSYGLLAAIITFISIVLKDYHYLYFNSYDSTVDVYTKNENHGFMLMFYLSMWVFLVALIEYFMHFELLANTVEKIKNTNKDENNDQ